MKTIEQLDNLSAQFRLLQKKTLHWTPEQWQLGLLGWSQGKFAPGVVHTDGVIHPCVYAEVLQGNHTHYLVVTQHGFFITSDSEYTLEKSGPWEQTAELSYYGGILQKALDKKINNTTMHIANFIDPVLEYHDSQVYRHPIPYLENVLNGKEKIPTFFSKEACFTWLEKVCHTHVKKIDAAAFFTMLENNTQTAEFLKEAVVWEEMLNYLPDNRNWTNFDTFKNFPSTQKLDDWLYVQCGSDRLNLNTKFNLHLKNTIDKKIVCQDLAELIRDWQKNDVELFSKKYSTKNIWVKYLPGLLTTYGISENLEPWLWPACISQYLTGDQFKKICHAIYEKHESAKVHPTWLELAAQQVTRSNITMMDLPEPLGHHLLGYLLESTNDWQLTEVLHVIQDYVKNNAELSGRTTLLNVLQVFSQHTKQHEKDDEEHRRSIQKLVSLCQNAWPEKTGKWQMMDELGVDLSAWRQTLLLEEKANAGPLPALPYLHDAGSSL